MKTPKVSVFIEKSATDIERAVSFKSDVEVDQYDDVNVYLTPEKALMALALLAETIGAEVYFEGQIVDLVL